MVDTAPVAVVVPVFNRRLKLLKTLETIVAQSKLPALLVVVDDGSTDGTAIAAKDWLTRNAAFNWRVLSQANCGVSVARNVGFAHIGDLPFVCFLDSDELWPPEFIAEGLRALEGGEGLVAAAADRAGLKKGVRRGVQSLALLASNPLLWLICNNGAILSCTIMRSAAAQMAGLFAPEMRSGEDTDFLMRLFLLGGVAHSKASPVLYSQEGPAEPTEPRNLSDEGPERRLWWAQNLAVLASKLPEELLKSNEQLVRTAVARRWADAAIFARQRGERKLALVGLLHSIWWDYDWRRRLELVCALALSRRSVLARFSTPYRETTLEKTQRMQHSKTV
jgi:glycosyltransferase involved in cell wall biosynthesis